MSSFACLQKNRCGTEQSGGIVQKTLQQPAENNEKRASSTSLNDSIASNSAGGAPLSAQTSPVPPPRQKTASKHLSASDFRPKDENSSGAENSFLANAGKVDDNSKSSSKSPVGRTSKPKSNGQSKNSDGQPKNSNGQSKNFNDEPKNFNDQSKNFNDQSV